VLVLMVLGASAASQWWAGRSDARLGQQLAERALPGDIRMLSSTTCAYCGAARDWMRQHRVSFGECFIETDKECAAVYESLRTPGTPVLVVRGKAQLGFDPHRVLGALAVPAS
jgi:glutaredoxin